MNLLEFQREMKKSKMFAVTICLAAKVFDFTDDLLLYSVLLDFSVVPIKRTDPGHYTI